MKQLTIISHTEHYIRHDGVLVGFGATVTEINQLLDVFDKIVHVAVLYNSLSPESALPYQSEAIRFVALPVVGGPHFSDKLNIIWKAPKILKIIRNSLKGSTHFQFRAPTGMGVYVIPYLMFFSTKLGWFKYAGNWQQDHAPLAYRFQRWLLKNQKRKVTINGSWENQPNNCLSFENPCLTHHEFRDGIIIRKDKSLVKNRISMCFVGRLESAKGFYMFLKSLNALNENLKHLIETVHVIGEIKENDSEINIEVPGVSLVYHGSLARQELHQIYKICHYIVLPSKSEGFPKVISEALNYGCVPVVSNVSAIGQYIKDGKQGFLMEELNQTCLIEKLQECLGLGGDEFKEMISHENNYYNQFSYNHYNQRILKEII